MLRCKGHATRGSPARPAAPRWASLVLAILLHKNLRRQRARQGRQLGLSFFPLRRRGGPVWNREEAHAAGSAAALRRCRGVSLPSRGALRPACLPASLLGRIAIRHAIANCTCAVSHAPRSSTYSHTEAPRPPGRLPETQSGARTSTHTHTRTPVGVCCAAATVMRSLAGRKKSNCPPERRLGRRTGWARRSGPAAAGLVGQPPEARGAAGLRNAVEHACICTVRCGTRHRPMRAHTHALN